jgi:hypothetical protein
LVFVRDVARAPPPDTGDTVKADRLDEVEVEDVQLQDDPSDDRDPCKIENHEKKDSYSTLSTKAVKLTQNGKG